MTSGTSAKLARIALVGGTTLDADHATGQTDQAGCAGHPSRAARYLSDGRGDGAVTGTFDYSGSRVGSGVPEALGGQEVDAIANGGYLLFNSVIANSSALLFSVDGDGSIYSESIGGAGAVWAANGINDRQKTLADCHWHANLNGKLG